jgi:ERCC4-type nuclease
MKPDPNPLPPIIVDKREQRPWTFGSDLICQLMGGPMHFVRGTLSTGDYSVQGIEGFVSIERKSLPDFLSCCTRERDRFKAEMERLKHYPVRAVVIEASAVDVQQACYRSQVRPQSVLATALAIQCDYAVPVYWAGSRESAEWSAAWMLRRAWQLHLARAAEAAAAAESVDTVREGAA